MGESGRKIAMKQDTKTAGESDRPTILIKKYANRRLYNTETSSYITLETLARLTREGREFTVVDAKNDEDITHGVLTQIIMDEESRGSTLLPAGFLRQLIGMYGDSMQGMVPGYLEASMDAFRRNHAQFHQAMKGALTTGPFAEIAKRNMAMLEAATSAFAPDRPAQENPSVTDPKSTEIETLQAQIADLQSRVDKLSK